jgi:hypothetical protein
MAVEQGGEGGGLAWLECAIVPPASARVPGHRGPCCGPRCWTVVALLLLALLLVCLAPWLRGAPWPWLAPRRAARPPVVPARVACPAAAVAYRPVFSTEEGLRALGDKNVSATVAYTATAETAGEAAGGAGVPVQLVAGSCCGAVRTCEGADGDNADCPSNASASACGDYFGLEHGHCPPEGRWAAGWPGLDVGGSAGGPPPRSPPPPHLAHGCYPVEDAAVRCSLPHLGCAVPSPSCCTRPCLLVVCGAA